MTYRQVLRELGWDNYGIVTVEMAKDHGVPTYALRQLATRGALTRRGHGVYRMEEIPPNELTEFAEAVALCGIDAMLMGTTVLAAHNLAQINLRRIEVAVPRRMRAKLPVTVKATQYIILPGDKGNIEGIPATTVKRALIDSIGLVMTERLVSALEQAKNDGYVTKAEYQEVSDILH